MKAVDSVVERAVAAGGKLVRPVENQFYGEAREMKRRAAAMASKT